MKCEICGTELTPNETSQPVCYDCCDTEAYADWEWKQTHKNVKYTDGIERIATERNKQINDHGFTDKHDNCHYAAYSAGLRILVYDDNDEPYTHRFIDPFPWDEGDDARKIIENTEQRIRLLEKAGALIAAEIDRLIRDEL
jgi:hypothetical protein